MVYRQYGKQLGWPPTATKWIHKLKGRLLEGGDAVVGDVNHIAERILGEAGPLNNGQLNPRPYWPRNGPMPPAIGTPRPAELYRLMVRFFCHGMDCLKTPFLRLFSTSSLLGEEELGRGRRPAAGCTSTGGIFSRCITPPFLRGGCGGRQLVRPLCGSAI